jgi:hypothetical protein
MLVNFSEKEVTLPKATVVDVSEEISPSLVAALKYLHNFADSNSRLIRWILRLTEFGFSIEHRPGT